MRYTHLAPEKFYKSYQPKQSFIFSIGSDRGVEQPGSSSGS
jgi:hypothetical protein